MKNSVKWGILSAGNIAGTFAEALKALDWWRAEIGLSYEADRLQ